MKTLIEKNRKSFFLIVALVLFNVLTLATVFSNPAKAEKGSVAGILGSQLGVPTCHCPDDTATCNCAG